MKPKTVHYERSTVINASPEKILPHIADFHKWTGWTPYEKMDPNMKRAQRRQRRDGREVRVGW